MQQRQRRTRKVQPQKTVQYMSAVVAAETVTGLLKESNDLETSESVMESPPTTLNAPDRISPTTVVSGCFDRTVLPLPSPPAHTSNTRNYRKHYCAIDIETGGPKIGKHPLIRIGIALVDENAVTIEKRAFPIPFQRACFDPNTLQNFWQNETKRPGITSLLDYFEGQSNAVYAEAMKQGHPPIVYALGKFMDYFDDLHNRYADVVLIGDFIEFDYCVLNYYLSVYLHRPPINYYSRRSNFPVRAHSTSTFYHTICALVGSEWDTTITIDNDSRALLQSSASLTSSASPPDRTNTSCFANTLNQMLVSPSYQCIASMPSGRQKALAILGVNPHAIAPTQLNYDHNPENDAEETVVVYVLARRAWSDMIRRMQPTIHNEIVSKVI